MRYQLIPGPGCPPALCDQLNAALSTPSARRVYHAAKSAFRHHREHSDDAFLAYLTRSTNLPVSELPGVLRTARLSLLEAMLLPVLFDMTARWEPAAS